MNALVISHLTLRRIIGILAILFPVILLVAGMLDGPNFEKSLSAYYWTNAGVLFTGMLITFSICLFSYKGYDIWDRVITNVSAVSMLMVALFPCEGGIVYLFQFVSVRVTATIHYIVAVITFSMLGVMSLVQFTRSSGHKTAAKRKRNRVYQVCGWVIFGTLIMVFVFQATPGGREISEKLGLLFWQESIILWAFGTAWLVKGRGIRQGIKEDSRIARRHKKP